MRLSINYQNPVFWSIFLLAQGVRPAFAESPKTLPTIDVFDAKSQALSDDVDGEDLSVGVVSGHPGAARVIGKKELKTRKPISTQDALKNASGVAVVETDGVGFFPRLGIRGLSPDGSRKLLLLEDGAPIQPGPFLDPSSYYGPSIDRAERLEVIKGSGSLRFGPQTVGGVINQVTKRPPLTPTSRFSVMGGGQKFSQILAEAGGTYGQSQSFVQVSRREGAGNRDYNDYTSYDIMAKYGFSPAPAHHVGFKVTYYTLDAAATYQGQTAAMFARNVRENAARNDRFNGQRVSFDLTHEWALGTDTSLTSLLYYNRFQRDWWRENFNAVSGGLELASAGTNTGRLRTFNVGGFDTRLKTGFGLETGIRLHRESMTNQQIDGATPTSRSGTITADDLRDVYAGAFFAQNAFHLTDSLTLTPGVRVERYTFARDIYRWSSANVNSKTYSPELEALWGVGVSQKFSPKLEIFAGAHRGFAPPRIEDALDNSGAITAIDAERSLNLELGVRGSDERFHYEVAAFSLDFSNQIVPATQSAGAGASGQTNAGSTLHQGVESNLGYRLGLGLSARVNYTWVPVAKLTSRRILSGADREGNRVTYAPEHFGVVGLDGQWAKFGAQIELQAQTDQFADLENTVIGTANGRAGKIPGFAVVNIGADYALNSTWSVFGSAKNLLDRHYIASRAPQGIFPGLTRFVVVGVSAQL